MTNGERGTKIKSQNMKRFTRRRNRVEEAKTKKRIHRKRKTRTGDGRKSDGSEKENDGRGRAGSQEPGEADDKALGILSSAFARHYPDDYFQVRSDLRRTDRVSGLQRGGRIFRKPLGGAEMVRTLFQQL